MKRVMIIGGAGSGKSTLARQIGDKTGLPVIHIDPMFWKAGWVQRRPEETTALALKATESEEWVFEGNHSATMDARLARADTLIFLDIGTVRRLWRIALRTLCHYGRTRPDMAEGCPERFDWDFIKWVAGYRRGGRVKALRLIRSAPPHVRMLHLHDPAEVRTFLANIPTGRPVGQPEET
ncbi:DNA topology modulation protein FlaR [Phyllobacterium phragmitis]|uniref:DNA topology modulation protein FlaR n=1 Tax=Phyllobacterium phragmitis TaxID=2670329 RepID=A0A2S9IZ71_9HYPH|nr:DNA topology modulation protein FlaR [Phyllobacterium phragmitis]PRD45825.1 DNA topology modulation protein FlaR [Phyllobacterium phragmitis]